MGIAPEIISKIFDPFFTTKPVGEGNGMGLAAVHGIVTRHEGAIEVQSESGKGALFSVYFPKTQNILSVEKNSSKEAPGGTERIMIVDDNTDLVEMMGDVLESLGYRIDKFTASSDALDFFKENAPYIHLVILDQTMPKMVGTKLARELKQIKSDVHVLLCTGQEDGVLSQEARAIGIHACIGKPVSLPELTQAVRMALDHRIMF